MVREYEELSKHLWSLFLDKGQLIGTLKNLADESEAFEPFLEIAEDVTVYEFIVMFSTEEFKGSFIYDLYTGQKELFEFMFGEDVFDSLENEEQFEYCRQLMVEMNDISFELPNPNPELARLDKMKQKLMELKGENITFEAMYSSVLLSSSVHPNDLTLYQFNKAFDRVVHFKNYDTSTLFKTVDQSGKMDISPWYGTTKDKEPSTISQEQLDHAKKLQQEGGLATNL